MRDPHKADLAWKRKSLGKSEARGLFLPLVDAVAQGAPPVEITDHGKPVAMLISKHEYDWLQVQSKRASNKITDLRGSITIIGDLEEGSREIAKLFDESLDKTARDL